MIIFKVVMELKGKAKIDFEKWFFESVDFSGLTEEQKKKI